MPAFTSKTLYLYPPHTQTYDTPLCTDTTSKAVCLQNDTNVIRWSFVNPFGFDYQYHSLSFNVYGFLPTGDDTRLIYWNLQAADKKGGLWMTVNPFNECPKTPPIKMASYQIAERLPGYTQDFTFEVKTLRSDACLTMLELSMQGELINPNVYNIKPQILLRGDESTEVVRLYAYNWNQKRWNCRWFTIAPTPAQLPSAEGIPSRHDPRILTCLVPNEAYTNFTEGLTLIVSDMNNTILSYAIYNFSIYDPPTISSISPDKGSIVGATSVTIKGTGFVMTPSTRVLFGNLPAFGLKVTDSKTITCLTPPWYLNKTTNNHSSVDYYAPIYVYIDVENSVTNDQVRFRYLDEIPNVPDGPENGPVPSLIPWIKKYMYVPILIGIALLGLACLSIYLVCRNRRDDGYTELKQVAADQDMSAKVIIKGADLTLQKRIGRGQYADVYLSKWKFTEVAVKRMRNMEEDAMGDTIQEAKVMLQLRHPNVVAFLGISSIEGDLCLVTEFLARGSLRDILAKPDVYILELEHKRQICLHAANGMDYLHTQNLIHRDLKSANLLVGKHWEVKVGDFGLSKFLEDQKTNHTLTSCGTPYFSAPEVLKKAKYSFQADVYSFGMVLYELWVSPNLFEGNPYKVLTAIIKKNLRPAIPSTFPKGLSSLMEECWHRSPSYRPSFRQVLERLEALDVPKASTLVPVVKLPEGSESGSRRSTRERMSKKLGRKSGALTDGSDGGALV